MSHPEPPPDNRALRIKAEREAAQANLVSIANTKLAACLDALGFAWDFDATEHAQKGTTSIQFHFRGGSERPGFQHLTLHVAKSYISGGLEKEDSTHPLCVMMRAQHNYDRLLEMQRGTAMRLVATPCKRMTLYKHGPEMEAMRLRGVQEWTDDLMLAAAVAGVGLPALLIDGVAGTHRYWFPTAGYVLQNEEGAPVEYTANAMLQRAPTPQDPFRLALEDTHPLHPVCLAYDALFARARLKAALLKRQPNILHQDGALKAIVTSNYTHRVIEKLRDRFGAPIL